MEALLVMKTPKPIWCIQLDSAANGPAPKFDWMTLLIELQKAGHGDVVASGFRGVDFDKLPTVLTQGIDVSPPDSVIYVGEFDKAWEYSPGWPKLVMALDRSKLDLTYREVPASTPQHELDELKRTFSTIVTSQCGTKHWLSRLNPESPQLGTSYEWDYARWIPGNAVDALKAVLIFCTDIESVLAALSRSAAPTVA